MKKMLCSMGCVLAMSVAPVRAEEASLGLGLRVFRTVDSLPNAFTEMGVGGYVNWRTFWTEWVSGQLELALYEDGYAGAPQEVLSPQAFVLLGREWYAGLGAGMLFADGDFSDQPFLALRAGYQRGWTDWMTFDVSVTYEYAEWEGDNDEDASEESDTVVLAAGVRMYF